MRWLLICYLVAAIGEALQNASPQLSIMYGGAWKGPHAEQNILDAVALGYRAFDTANVYAASYNETAMGVALERAVAAGLRRDELFIQTKFTPGVAKSPASGCVDGPWDPSVCMFDKNADLATQVKQSAQTSLAHLRVKQLDSLVLHESRQSWEDLLLIWRTLEELHGEGKTASIGLSHIHDANMFRRLLGVAKIKPSFVQHPVFAYNGWDREIRQICREHGIVFQAYSLNHPENDFVYQTEAVQQIAQRLDRTPRQVIVAMTKRLGLLPLVGPQDAVFQAQAVAAAVHLPDLLTDAEVETLENIGTAAGGVVSSDGRAKVRGSVRSTDGTLQGDDARASFTVTNNLRTDIYMAWQTPDHSSMRTEKGMHADADRIVAGGTRNTNTFHRHGFYFWDVAEGNVAPLYREGADKRWVRRARVNGFLRSAELEGSPLDIVIDGSFKVVVVNLGGGTDVEIFLAGVPSCAVAGKAVLCKAACASRCRGFPPGFKVGGCAAETYCTSPPAWAQDSVCNCDKAATDGLTSLGVAKGGGGSLNINARDGHTIVYKDASGTSKKVKVRRSDGDPQLLTVGMDSVKIDTHHDRGARDGEL